MLAAKSGRRHTHGSHEGGVFRLFKGVRRNE